MGHTIIGALLGGLLGGAIGRWHWQGTLPVRKKIFWFALAGMLLGGVVASSGAPLACGTGAGAVCQPPAGL